MTKICKAALALVLVCLFAVSLTACAKAVTVKVNDMGTTTDVEAKTGMTVAEVLEQAGIALGEKDETEPAVDVKLEETTTDITVKRYAKVTFVNGETKTDVEVVGGTVADALKAAGITLGEKELTDVEGTEYVKDGMTVNILTELTISLTVDGKTEDVATKATTVKDFLDEQKVTLGDDDEVSPKLEDALKDGGKVVVKRVEYKEETKTETIDYSTEEQYSSSMASGTSEVTQNGVEGEKEVTYKVKYVDGEEESREQVSEKVTKEAVNKIVTYGTKQAAPQKTEVSRQNYPDCDGSGHGYYEITYSDGSTAIVEY